MIRKKNVWFIAIKCHFHSCKLPRGDKMQMKKKNKNRLRVSEEIDTMSNFC